MITEHGAEAAVLDLLLTGELVWCVSPAILAEYHGVLARPKFSDLDKVRLARVLDLLVDATLIVPSVTRIESPDDPDNRFLECAEAASAQYLVTGNARHFPTEWKSTRVVNARKLLALIRTESEAGDA
jgi:putative PIN family toxin of toxin-antitoxin system